MAKVPAKSEWRKNENTYNPEDLQKAPEAAPEGAVLALTEIK